MAEPLLEVRGLTHAFPLGRRAVLRAVDHVSFTLRRGEVLGLVGESGSGKSTIARCVMNLLRPQSGQILYRGIDICDRRAFRANRRTLQAERQIIFQDSGSSLNGRLPHLRPHRRTAGEQAACRQPGQMRGIASPCLLTSLLPLSFDFYSFTGKDESHYPLPCKSLR